MSTAEEYETRIRTYDWDRLIILWQAVIARDTPDWAAGKALEYIIMRAFQLDGADVMYPYRVLLAGEEAEQIDGLVYTDGLACLIECKDLTNKVNIEPIAKMRNQLLRRPSPTIGAIFSRSGFTDPALILAQFNAPQTILLWDVDEIEYALRERYMRRGLIDKYRYCISHGYPDYNITVRGIA